MTEEKKSTALMPDEPARPTQVHAVMPDAWAQKEVNGVRIGKPGDVAIPDDAPKAPTNVAALLLFLALLALSFVTPARAVSPFSVTNDTVYGTYVGFYISNSVGNFTFTTPTNLAPGASNTFPNTAAYTGVFTEVTNTSSWLYGNGFLTPFSSFSNAFGANLSLVESNAISQAGIPGVNTNSTAGQPSSGGGGTATAGFNISGNAATATLASNLVPGMNITDETFTASSYSGTHTGVGSGLTALTPANISGGTAPINITGSSGNSAALGNVGSGGYVQNYIPNLFWWSAQQASLANPSATNGQFIPPVDYSGNGWVIATNSIGTTRSPVFTSAFGRSGFYLNSSAMVVSNLPLALTNGFTITVTYQNLGGIPPPQGFIWAMGGYGVSDGKRNIYAEEADNQGSVSAGEGGGETGGSLFYGNLLFGTPAGLYQSAGSVHIATLTFDGSSNIWMTYDGMPTYDSRIERNANWSTLLTGATNFYIGSDVSTEYGGAYFTGIILDIRIYTPYCQPGLQQSLLTYLCQNAGLPINRFIFDGDSIMASLHTWTSLSAVQQILAPFFQGYLFNTTAQSGRTTAQELTNMYQFAPQKLPGFNGILEQACVNDFNFGINGTPFMPNAAIKGAGVSCQKLVGAIYSELGVIPAGTVIDDGPMAWATAQKESLIEKFMGALPGFETIETRMLPRPGDMLGFKIDGCIHHCGVTLQNGRFIHCWRHGGVMFSHIADATYWSRLGKIWRPLERDRLLERGGVETP